MNFRTLTHAVLLCFSTPLWALTGDFTKCPESFIVPPLASDDSQHYALCYNGFAVQYSAQTKTPVFAAAALDKERVIGARNTKRQDRFYEEARLPSKARSLLSDYKHSGYDRGHMYPAGDSANDETSAQSMSLANMVPQASELNRGIWAKIESDTRRYAMRAQGKVYVLTGPAYLNSNSKTIGRGVAVPSHVWKLVQDASTQKSWAYWIENSDDAKQPELIDKETLSKRTGLHFYGH
ncbi:MAG: DNA/RNA non-specific endonuclease [Burkholderiales bacterium]|jgi:endonuclease G|nr:DNA/RNA non-specific endonuclease [Burkholderiales bacterium]